MKILFHSNAMSEMRNKSRRLSKTSKNNFQIFLFQFLLTMQVMQRFATSGWSNLTLVINYNCVWLLMYNKYYFSHCQLCSMRSLRPQQHFERKNTTIWLRQQRLGFNFNAERTAWKVLMLSLVRWILKGLRKYDKYQRHWCHYCHQGRLQVFRS